MLTQPQNHLNIAQKFKKGFQLEYSVSTHIQAPIEKIWEILTQAEHYSDWNPAILSLKGTIQAQARLELVSSVAPKTIFKITVSELKAPHVMVWQSGKAPVFSGCRRFQLEQDDEGVLFTMREHFQGLLLPLIALTIPDLRDNFAEFAADLKKIAEEHPDRDLDLNE